MGRYGNRGSELWMILQIIVSAFLGNKVCRILRQAKVIMTPYWLRGVVHSSSTYLVTRRVNGMPSNGLLWFEFQINVDRGDCWGLGSTLDLRKIWWWRFRSHLIHHWCPCGLRGAVHGYPYIEVLIESRGYKLSMAPFILASAYRWGQGFKLLVDFSRF